MRKNGLSIIDDQMRPHAGRLGNEVRIQPPQAYSVATTIFDEIIASDTDLLEAIRNSSPLSVQRRLLFFEDYQTWDTVIRAATQCPSEHPLLPQIVQRSYIEMQLVVHLYCSFVFTGDGLFEVLKKKALAGSCTKKCAQFVRENSVRALRNAVAHGNWQMATWGSIDYWARKGAGSNPCPTCNRPRQQPPLTQYHTTLDDLMFYLDLTRCTAWASLLAVVEASGEAREDIDSV